VLTVSTHKAEGLSSEMINRASEGEPVFIKRYGKPIVALVPASYVRRVKRLGVLAGKLRLPADLDAPSGGPC
jgi:prevent-host-death family protein